MGFAKYSYVPDVVLRIARNQHCRESLQKSKLQTLLRNEKEDGNSPSWSLCERRVSLKSPRNLHSLKYIFIYSSITLWLIQKNLFGFMCILSQSYSLQDLQTEYYRFYFIKYFFFLIVIINFMNKWSHLIQSEKYSKIILKIRFYFSTRLYVIQQ